MLGMLAPPEGIADMVLDTDTYNEVDDQFALCYALLSPERINLLAVTAAPFLNDRSVSAGDGMRKSYDEIVRLLGKMNISPDGFVYKGSESFMKAEGEPVKSPAAEKIVELAMAEPEGKKLYVVAIGAITNVASALIMEPAIKEKISIVWLGGQPLSYVSAAEFNLSSDIIASRTVLNSGAALTLIPCQGVASHLLASVPELQTWLGGKNAMCDALVELFAAYNKGDAIAWAKEIWDVSTIGYMVNPDWVRTVVVHSPALSLESRWSEDPRRHFMRIATGLDRNRIFKDMFTKLASFRE